MSFAHYSRRRCLLLAVALLLSACTTFETGKTKLRKVKTVGVISVIGDQFSFTRTGLNGRTDATQYFPINSWGLDAMIEHETTAVIGTRFQVQAINYDRAVFVAPPQKDSPVKPLNLLRKDRWKQLLKAHVSPEPVDAYVVITRADSTFGPSDRIVTGIGGLTVRTLTGQYHQLHALYQVTVFDGHNYDLLESRSAAPLNNTDIVRLAGPSTIVDETYMPGSGNPADNEKLKSRITGMILSSLAPTLSNLHLTNATR